MVETRFLKLLQNHSEALSDRRQFSSLLKDLMPGMALQSNIILNLYDLDIHSEIDKTVQIDNSFVYRFTKKLCDEYGVSKRNADWAVETWCNCYGKSILGKKIDTAPLPTAYDADKDGAPAQDPFATTFDVAANEYIDDWRNTYEYEIEYGGVIIKKYIAFDSVEVTVPDTIEGYPVVELGEEAFHNCKAMKTVCLPNSLRIIRRKAFENCTFEGIELPESLDEIEYNAFGSCRLRSICVPSRVKRINRYVFSNCELLSSVKLPKELISIEGYAFLRCTALECIDVPEGTREIGEKAFEDCERLRKIRIPRSVTRMWREDADDENIFGELTKQNLTIYCQAGSEALKYARRHSIEIEQYDNYSE